MTTSETMEELTRRGQEAFASAMRIWVDTWRPFVPGLPAPDAKVPSAEEVVDKAFDFAEQALEAQRALAKQMLATTKSARDNAWAVQDATKNAAAKKSSPSS